MVGGDQDFRTAVESDDASTHRGDAVVVVVRKDAGGRWTLAALLFLGLAIGELIDLYCSIGAAD